MTPEKLDFILRGAEVKRFHSVKTLQEETVGHHSFLVAVLCMELELTGTAPHNLLKAALYHDLPECETGDIPSQIKSMFVGVDAAEKILLRDYGLLIELNPKEARTLKLADVLAGLVFCIRERELGSKLTQVIEYRYRDYIKSMEPFSEIENKVVRSII